MAAQQLYISLKKYSTCGSNFWSGKCKDRGQAMRISEMIKLCYFYSHWGVDNRTLYFNVEVTPGRVFVCLQSHGALNISIFFLFFFLIFLPQSHSTVVWFSLSDPRVHVRTRVVVSPSPSRMWTKRVLDCYFYFFFYKISTRAHNQNKSTTRAFPAAMTSRKPSPSPSRVNRKRDTKCLCQCTYVRLADSVVS